MNKLPAYIPDYFDAVLAIEPVLELIAGEPLYRAEVHLRGGTFLPCVIFRSASARVRHAERGLENSRRGDTLSGVDYLSMIKILVCGGHQISATSIRDVAPSRNAIPARIREDLYAMAQVRHIDLSAQWLWFRGEMEDGARFDFGFSENQEFFEMPPGYRASQLIRVDTLRKKPDRPFGGTDVFVCYLDGLE